MNGVPDDRWGEAVQGPVVGDLRRAAEDLDRQDPEVPAPGARLGRGRAPDRVRSRDPRHQARRQLRARVVVTAKLPRTGRVAVR
ncbi:hypothetical protein ACFWQL_05325 [Amycolatopsis thermoflava]|uniref:hypothetical protein n=1 Tax=Amycolatopsis thermoflava TaxID=84480 RepID=UPI0036552D82